MDDCPCPCHVAHPAQECTFCMAEDCEEDDDETGSDDAE